MNPRYLIFLTSLLILTACGQKGPLYLPEDNPAETNEAQAQPSPATGEAQIETASQRKPDK